MFSTMQTFFHNHSAAEQKCYETMTRTVQQLCKNSTHSGHQSTATLNVLRMHHMMK